MRPPGKTNHERKAKAFDLFLAGLSKTDIAREIGVTRQAIGAWAKDGRWDDRLAGVVQKAEDIANSVQGNIVADMLIKLRGKAAQRIAELDRLCGPLEHPTTRLKAIQLWLKLAGIDRALPDPVEPTNPRSLRLVEDLLEDEANVG